MSEVTRDWDAERQVRYPKPSTFKIAGEHFTILQGISPEEFSEKARPYFEMTKETSAEEATSIADAFVITFLADEDGAERWHRIRAQRDPAVTAREIREIIQWILEEQTGHPTTLPEPSSNGGGSTGENSTETSSSSPADSEASVV